MVVSSVLESQKKPKQCRKMSQLVRLFTYIKLFLDEINFLLKSNQQSMVGGQNGENGCQRNLAQNPSREQEAVRNPSLKMAERIVLDQAQRNKPE